MPQPATRPMPRVFAPALLMIAGAAAAADHKTPGPEIRIDDVARFYALYDTADGRPTAEQLQRYIDQGSEGLRHFARARDTTGERIAAMIDARPEIYLEARRCMTVLPRVRERVDAALEKLVRLYPQAKTPPVTIAVGRGKPVGIGSPEGGLQIGLEALCATRWLNPDVEDRFVYVIVHEYAHVQQAPALADAQGLTVLERALVEGAAEFVAELTSGGVAYSHFGPLTAGREREIETAFVADMHGTDLSAWLDNSTADTPRDLGYWVGYRIVKAYYRHADDKRTALADILGMTDAKAFLERSGWTPGMTFDQRSGACAPLRANHASDQAAACSNCSCSVEPCSADSDDSPPAITSLTRSK